jgi:hypothetical protein
MPIMTKILVGLSVEYLLIAGGFAWVRDWPRCFYFLAATGLNLTVIFMR